MRLIFVLTGCLVMMAIATILIVTAIIAVFLLIDFIRDFW